MLCCNFVRLRRRDKRLIGVTKLQKCNSSAVYTPLFGHSYVWNKTFNLMMMLDGCALLPLSAQLPASPQLAAWHVGCCHSQRMHKTCLSTSYIYLGVPPAPKVAAMRRQPLHPLPIQRHTPTLYNTTATQRGAPHAIVSSKRCTMRQRTSRLCP